MSRFGPCLPLIDKDPEEPIPLLDYLAEARVWWRSAAEYQKMGDYETSEYCCQMAQQYTRVLRMISWAPRCTRVESEVAA